MAGDATTVRVSAVVAATRAQIIEHLTCLADEAAGPDLDDGSFPTRAGELPDVGAAADFTTEVLDVDLVRVEFDDDGLECSALIRFLAESPDGSEVDVSVTLRGLPRAAKLALKAPMARRFTGPFVEGMVIDLLTPESVRAEQETERNRIEFDPTMPAISDQRIVGVLAAGRRRLLWLWMVALVATVASTTLIVITERSGSEQGAGWTNYGVQPVIIGVYVLMLALAEWRRFRGHQILRGSAWMQSGIGMAPPPKVNSLMPNRLWLIGGERAAPYHVTTALLTWGSEAQLDLLEPTCLVAGEGRKRVIWKPGMKRLLLIGQSRFAAVNQWRIEHWST